MKSLTKKLFSASLISQKSFAKIFASNLLIFCFVKQKLKGSSSGVSNLTPLMDRPREKGTVSAEPLKNLKKDLPFNRPSHSSSHSTLIRKIS